jgi:hypothetical protein
LRKREIEYLVNVVRLKPMLDEAMDHNHKGLRALIQARRDRNDVAVMVKEAQSHVDPEAKLLVKRSADSYESAIGSFRIAQRKWAKLAELGGGDFQVMRRTIKREIRARRYKHMAFEELDIMMSKYPVIPHT